MKARGDYPPASAVDGLHEAVSRFFAEAERVWRESGGDETQWGSIFQRHVEEPLIELFGQGFVRGAAMVNAIRAGSTEFVSFNLENARAVAHFQRYIIRLRQSVVSTMTDRLIAAAVSPIDKPAFVAPHTLNDALAAAVREGDSVQEATVRVHEAFERMSTYSADRIAQTEVGRAYNEGKLSSWRDIPGVTHKRWLLSGSPCEACIDLHSQRPVVPINEPFARIGETFGGLTITYADVMVPTLHPQDHCGMTLVFEDEAPKENP